MPRMVYVASFSASGETDLLVRASQTVALQLPACAALGNAELQGGTAMNLLLAC